MAHKSDNEKLLQYHVLCSQQVDRVTSELYEYGDKTKLWTFKSSQKIALVVCCGWRNFKYFLKSHKRDASKLKVVGSFRFATQQFMFCGIRYLHNQQLIEVIEFSSFMQNTENVSNRIHTRQYQFHSILLIRQEKND